MTLQPDTLSHRPHTAASRMLNELLIDEYLLYTETRIGHWHLEDRQPPALRNLLQWQYETLDTLIDRVSAHMRAERYTPVLRPRAFQHIRTFLADDSAPTPGTMLKDLTRAHTTLLQRLQKLNRPGVTPAATAAVLEELTIRHEQMHCLLKAHLTLNLLQAHLSPARRSHDV